MEIPVRFRLLTLSVMVFLSIRIPFLTSILYKTQEWVGLALIFFLFYLLRDFLSLLLFLCTNFFRGSITLREFPVIKAKKTLVFVRENSTVCILNSLNRRRGVFIVLPDFSGLI